MRATSVICDQFGTEYIAANSRARRRKHADVGKDLCVYSRWPTKKKPREEAFQGKFTFSTGWMTNAGDRLFSPTILTS